MTDNSIQDSTTPVQVSTEVDPDEFADYFPAWGDTDDAAPPLVEDPDELLQRHLVPTNGAGYTATNAGLTQEATADAARAATVAATVSAIAALVANVPHDVHDGRYNYLLPALGGLVDRKSVV